MSLLELSCDLRREYSSEMASHAALDSFGFISLAMWMYLRMKPMLMIFPALQHKESALNSGVRSRGGLFRFRPPVGSDSDSGPDTKYKIYKT